MGALSAVTSLAGLLSQPSFTAGTGIDPTQAAATQVKFNQGRLAGQSLMGQSGAGGALGHSTMGTMMDAGANLGAAQLAGQFEQQDFATQLQAAQQQLAQVGAAGTAAGQAAGFGTPTGNFGTGSTG